ncbi:unannotated protein [freshwater metagenome]|uniref:Unannotated protein n=1 Tax=freshwater metagenome TaxID=449393 RepID=A0A6J7C6B3_9ZZZZ
MPADEFGDEVGVGNLRAGHLHAVAHPLAERPFGLTPVDDGALQEDGSLGQCCLHRAAQIDVEAGRFVEIWTGLLGREDRATYDHHVVESCSHERDGDLGGHLRGDARPRRQFVAGQAQADDGGADGAAHGPDHLASEESAILTPLIAALVSESGQELTHQAVLSGIDLDPVAPAVDGELGSAGEPGDDRSDVVGLHPFGHLARVHLWYPAGSPQLALVVCAAALTTGVVDAGDHQ